MHISTKYFVTFATKGNSNPNPPPRGYDTE